MSLLSRLSRILALCLVALLSIASHYSAPSPAGMAVEIGHTAPGCSDDQIPKVNGTVWNCEADAGGVGGGTSVELDLDEDSVLESTALTRINTQGDLYGVFSENPVGNQLRVNLSNRWPQSENAQRRTDTLRPAAATIAAIQSELAACNATDDCLIQLDCDTTYTSSASVAAVKICFSNHNHVTIQGCGPGATVLEWTYTSLGAGQGSQIIEIDLGTENVTIRDMTLRLVDTCAAGCASQSMYGISVAGNTTGTDEGFTFERLAFESDCANGAGTCVQGGILLGNAAIGAGDREVERVRITDSNFTNLGPWILLEYADDVLISGNTFTHADTTRSNGLHGIRKRVGDGVRIVGNEFDCTTGSTTAYGCLFLGFTSFDEELRSLQIEGNTFRAEANDTDSYPIYAPIYYMANIQGNYFLCGDGITAGQLCSGIWLNSADTATNRALRNVIEGNTFYGYVDDNGDSSTGSCPIKLEGDGAFPVQDNVIRDNTFNLRTVGGAQDTTGDGFCGTSFASAVPLNSIQGNYTTGSSFVRSCPSGQFVTAASGQDSFTCSGDAGGWETFSFVIGSTSVPAGQLDDGMSQSGTAPTFTDQGTTFNRYTADFDPTADETILTQFIVPQNYDGSRAPQLRYKAKASTTNVGNACMCAGYFSVSTASNIITQAAEQTSCAVSGTSGSNTALINGTINLDPTMFAASDYVVLHFFRDADESTVPCITGDDSFTGDFQVYLWSVEMPVLH